MKIFLSKKEMTFNSFFGIILCKTLTQADPAKINSVGTECLLLNH